MGRDRVIHWAALVWFALSTALLIAPLYTIFGNRVHPRVFGLPWSLVYVLLVIAANFAVLALLYRARVIDHAELQDGDDERGG